MTGTGENVDLITSIPSRLVRFGMHGASVGPAYQEACAASWVQNGLRPRSLNAPQELDQIPTLAGVSSEPFVQENPVVAPDHPGPSLGNIFDVVAPDEPCAITNADVYLLKVSGLPSLIRDLTRDALLVARRTDVTGLLGSAQGIFTTGIDFVAFRPDTVMPVMEDPGIRQFQLGVTWWDYVFPIAASFLVPVRRLREPFLIHHAHEAYWNNQQYETIRKQAKAVLASFAQRQSAKSEVAREFLRRLALTETAGSEHEVDVGFSMLCIEWLFGSLGPVQEIELPLDRDDAVFSALVSSVLADGARTGAAPAAVFGAASPHDTSQSDPTSGGDRSVPRSEPNFTGNEQSSLFFDLLSRSKPARTSIGRAMTKLEQLTLSERTPRFREILASSIRDLRGVAYLSGRALERHFRPKLRRLTRFGLGLRRKPSRGRGYKFVLGGNEVTYPLELFRLGKTPTLPEIAKASALDLGTIFVLFYRLCRRPPDRAGA